ncbi:MAG: hypothetical protein IJE43_15600 [Alphaproteobacteria bacterium]|nr:hypothetical protein [Alphaproteobacteria bacterium]
MNKIENNRILFISNNYFGYYKQIISTLKNRGAIVDWYSDVPTGVLSRLKAIVTDSLDSTYVQYYENIKKKLSEYYDYILVIKGDLVPTFFLDYLKSKYNSAQFIMYHWDDIEQFPSVIDRFKYFDRILSYNILDCEKYNLILRPVFYVPMQDINCNKFIDAFIVGSYNSIRGKFIKQFKKLNPEIDLYSHYYINPLIFIKEQLDWTTIHEYKFHKLSYYDMMVFVAKSKACLDVPHSFQQGLTTRSIEALPFQTKIITTNPNIKLYDYYSPVNHCIVDLNNPIIEKDWIEQPYEKVDEGIVMKYTIDYWVDDIFDLNI